MILEKIKEILKEQLDIDPDTVNPETSLRDDLEVDSLDLVEVILAIEEEFDIEVEDDAMDDLVTVNDAVLYIEKCIKNK